MSDGTCITRLKAVMLCTVITSCVQLVALLDVQLQHQGVALMVVEQLRKELSSSDRQVLFSLLCDSIGNTDCSSTSIALPVESVARHADAVPVPGCGTETTPVILCKWAAGAHCYSLGSGG